MMPKALDLQSNVLNHLTTSSIEVRGFEPLIVVSKTNILPLDYTSNPHSKGIEPL